MLRCGVWAAALGLLTAGWLACGEACTPSVSNDSADAGSQEPVDSGPQCQGTVAENCAIRPCLAEWPAELSAFCSIGTAPWFRGIRDPCGPYRVFVETWVDSGSVYYYDAASGELVAVVFVQNYDRTCAGGPPGFVEPTPLCDSLGTSLDCGGAGGAGGSGGADGG
jgi:hypothetical protein